MGNAFTPGLLVSERTEISKVRKLPLGGFPTVAIGDICQASTVVGRCDTPGRETVIKAAEQLELDPERLCEHLCCRKGDIVEVGQLLGSVTHLFGLLKSECTSPVRGFVEDISKVTGHITVREPSVVTEVPAYISGLVTEVSDKDVAISCTACVIQGIFGLGGEAQGEIAIASEDQDITEELLQNGDYRGKLIVGGRSVSAAGIRKAISLGAKGVIVASIGHGTMHDILGEYIGVAITGQEKLGLTIIITEGFGRLDMDERTLGLLKRHEGAMASFNGSTQIRAGVVRPEVIVPLWESAGSQAAHSSLAMAKELRQGTKVRIIRAPYFGELAKVETLPEQPVVIGTEAKVRVLEARLRDGRLVVVPRANVEIVD